MVRTTAGSAHFMSSCTPLLVTRLLELEANFERDLVLNATVIRDATSLFLNFKPHHITQRFACTFDGLSYSIIEGPIVPLFCGTVPLFHGNRSQGEADFATAPDVRPKSLDKQPSPSYHVSDATHRAT